MDFGESNIRELFDRFGLGLDKAIFLLECRILDFNNSVNRGDIAITDYDDPEMQAAFLNSGETSAEIMDDCFRVIEMIQNNPTLAHVSIEAVEYVHVLINAISTVT